MADEAAYWKRVAIWLANCHAATCEYDGSLKATSKHRRERFKSICGKAAEALDGRFPGATDRDAEWVRQRLVACSEKSEP